MPRSLSRTRYRSRNTDEWMEQHPKPQHVLEIETETYELVDSGAIREFHFWRCVTCKTRHLCKIVDISASC